jgi:hypothetical protein
MSGISVDQSSEPADDAVPLAEEVAPPRVVADVPETVASVKVPLAAEVAPPKVEVDEPAAPTAPAAELAAAPRVTALVPVTAAAPKDGPVTSLHGPVLLAVRLPPMLLLTSFVASEASGQSPKRLAVRTGVALWRSASRSASERSAFHARQ